MKYVNKQKLLLIFPPQWTPISPHFALPSLIGQLKYCGFIAEAMDLNIDFFNDILTKENIENSIKTTKQQFEYLQKNLLSVFSPKKKENDYTKEEQMFLYKYNRIKNYLQKNSNYFSLIPVLIDEAKKNIKSENFYDPKLLVQSINIIDKALEIISLPYTPTKIEFEGISNPFFKFNYETIKYFVLDDKSNIFKKYYEKRLDEIIKKNADFIAISLNSSSQIVPGLTLTYLLKQRTKAHINIGGNFFGRIADQLKKHKDFFSIFADSVSIEEGEGPIIEVAKFVTGEKKIQDVPNLMYKFQGTIHENQKMKPIKLNEMANINLDDYDFSKYFSPEIVLPYQSSRGCYWGKCSFCDQDFGQNFNVKSTDKVIAEFKEVKEKYNIEKFEFIDESVSPIYLDELSKKLKKQKDIAPEFFFDARLETAFTKKILNNGYEAGLRMVLWGLESGSKSVLELINKGIDLDKRFEILKDSKDVGIWNFAFIFFGFPTEMPKQQ